MPVAKALDKKWLFRELERDRKKKAREKIASLADQLREARKRRKLALREAKERCRAERIAARERARAMRLRVLEELREAMRAERAGARQACTVRLGEARGIKDSILRARAELQAEKKYEADLRRIERANRKRRQEAPRVTRIERHLEIATTHVRQRKRGAQETLGTLVLTSRRLVFLSATGGFDVLWRKVRTCTASNDHVAVATASAKGTGAFYVEDPLVAHAYMDALVRLDHRTLASARSESRRIPRDMAAAVWTRDRGRCNECGASPGPGVQLAFDHVIPFSLGGATTIENLQVLCTPCNLKKGSRL